LNPLPDGFYFYTAKRSFFLRVHKKQISRSRHCQAAGDFFWEGIYAAVNMFFPLKHFSLDISEGITYI
jgi:hypothetical protein